MKIFFIDTVRPSGVSVYTKADGVKFFTFSEREQCWYTVFRIIEVPNDCLSAAVPQRGEIPTLQPRRSRHSCHEKKTHAFPRPALKVPKNQNPYKGR
jgi:hypothetical protein